jgi:hypothetical protein
MGVGKNLQLSKTVRTVHPHVCDHVTDAVQVNFKVIWVIYFTKNAVAFCNLFIEGFYSLLDFIYRINSLVGVLTPP